MIDQIGRFLFTFAAVGVVGFGAAGFADFLRFNGFSPSTIALGWIGYFALYLPALVAIVLLFSGLLPRVWRRVEGTEDGDEEGREE